MSDACMVFFESGRCDLDGAVASLTRYGLAVEREGDRLRATRPGAPAFGVVRVTGPSVAAEAAEIGADTEHAEALSRCDARFDILVEDLDAALDEINTLIEVQGALQDASRGYLFVGWNGTLSEPWEE